MNLVACRNTVSTSIVIFSLFTLTRNIMADDCITCHSNVVGTRTAVIGQMTGSSHHVQGIRITGRHCYACHWEATSDGGIDERYHAGEKNKGEAVDLVVWSTGFRPTVYKPFSTAVAYKSSSLGSSQERSEIAKLTTHCISCHSDANNSTTPFDGDSRTPRQYAWDGKSVAARYNQKGLVPWGKYSTAQSNRKSKVIKAFSAHGNAAANQGGWTANQGYDGSIPVFRGGAGAQNVECFDCHNSHGSGVTGLTTSYRTFDGSQKGGLLKDTTAGLGGYGMNYRPSHNPEISSPNPYNPGAGLCFDCHETPQSGMTPWGYTTTFKASQPIMGYKDTHRFGAGQKGSTSRFAGRQTRTEISSSHLKAGKFLNFSTSERINGLCTPCHDPHGVSPSLGSSMAYAVPLLKGTWLTSPYREDAPPATMPTRGSYAGRAGNMSMSWDKGDLKGGSAEVQPPVSYNTDRNTFGPGKYIEENEEQFGGLCLKCHRKEKLATGRAGAVHRAVKGWGANKEHALPCSKCHQPHNSGLPRLMQTNCLESGPAGLRDSGTMSWISGGNENGNKVIPQSGSATTSKKAVKESVVGCHVRRAGNRTSGPPGVSSDGWKSVSAW